MFENLINTSLQWSGMSCDSVSRFKSFRKQQGNPAADAVYPPNYDKRGAHEVIYEASFDVKNFLNTAQP